MQFNQILMNTTSLCYVRQITIPAEREKQKCQQGQLKLTFSSNHMAPILKGIPKSESSQKKREKIVLQYFIFGFNVGMDFIPNSSHSS